MKALPLYDATVPIACTATAGELADRWEVLGRLRGALVGLERTEHGLLLRFGADAGVEAEVRAFVADEQACCRFWGFAVEPGPTQLVLRWDAPPDAAELLERFHELLAG